MFSLRKIGSFLKHLRHSRSSEHNGISSQRSSAQELLSEQNNLFELSFSDEDITTVDGLNGMNDFELAAQEYNLIPVLCTFLDRCITTNDIHEVLQYINGLALK